MRVLYFSETFGPHDRRFLSAIAEEKHEAIFLRRGGRVKENDLPPRVKQIPWTGRLDKAIAMAKPDLIHAGPMPTCGYLAAKSGFRPLVLMSWGWDILWDSNHNRLARARIKEALGSADVAIADCAAVANALVSLGFPKSGIAMFPWGVDLKSFHPSGRRSYLRRRLKWENQFVLLHLRSLEKLYDPFSAARAFVRAVRENSELRLLMAGDGSLYPKLVNFFSKNGVEGKVCMLGKVNQRLLPAYYRTADLYISSSKSDGSSVSLMEALACGTPALVSDIPGNREWVESGKQGWLAPVGDEGEFAEKILIAAAEKHRLVKMAKSARLVAEAKADWRRNQKGLFRAYEMALNGTS